MKQSQEINHLQNTRLLRFALYTIRCRASLAMTTLGTFYETTKQSILVIWILCLKFVWDLEFVIWDLDSTSNSNLFTFP
jgi:hypothetical protein